MEGLSSLLLWALFLNGTDGTPLVPEPIAVGIGMHFLQHGMTQKDVEAVLHLEHRHRGSGIQGTLAIITHEYLLTPAESNVWLITKFERNETKRDWGLRSAVLKQGNRVITKFEP
jgi:hypothetical protein